MAVLLLAEVTDGELAMDATAKAMTAAKQLGDVTILCCGASAAAAGEAAADHREIDAQVTVERARSDGFPAACPPQVRFSSRGHATLSFVPREPARSATRTRGRFVLLALDITCVSAQEGESREGPVRRVGGSGRRREKRRRGAAANRRWPPPQVVLNCPV